MSDRPPHLVVDNVRKEYSSVVAVDDLSFNVDPAEIFALLGPNGAGKTTTVRMLVGILRPDSGSIRFSHDGESLSRLPAPTLGYLPEERGLPREAPILPTIVHFGVLHGMSRSEARQRALEGLESWGLGGREKDRVDSLSKGNQQKVQFLAAGLHRPQFLVLDEPFSGLDPVNQQRFLEEIRALRDAGCTILLSAHQMDLVESIAARVLVMDQGRAVLHGTLEEIRSDSGAGVVVHLDLEENVPAAGVPQVAGVRRVTTVSPRQVELILEPSLPVGPVLQSMTAALNVNAVRTQQESLREIYLRTVGRTDLVEESAE